MVEYPYVLSPGKLKKFLEHIQSAGVPPKITTEYLSSVGFKSSNDRRVVSVLKFINFADTNGVPTDEYRWFRNKEKAKLVMAKSLKAAYKSLFGTFSDADRKDTEALRNYFSTHTTAGEQVVNATVTTFKALCEFADFEAEPEGTVESTKAELESEASVNRQVMPAISSQPQININIQLQLPETKDPEIYDNLFSALKKHLLP